MIAAFITASAQAAIIQERGRSVGHQRDRARPGREPLGHRGVQRLRGADDPGRGGARTATPSATTRPRWPPARVGACGSRSRARTSWSGSTRPRARRPPHDGPTGLPCGPVAIVDGGDNRMYFSMPTSLRCGTARQLGRVADGTGGTARQVARRGLRPGGRAAASSSPRTTAPTSSAALLLGSRDDRRGVASARRGQDPDGIAVDGAGIVWVTLWGTGHVGRFPATQNLGTRDRPDAVRGHAPESVRHRRRRNDGRVYVTGKDSQEPRPGRQRAATGSFYPTADGEPWQIVNGPDGDLFFTDRSSTRVLRFLSGRAAGEHGRGDRRGRQRGMRDGDRRHARQRHGGRLRLRPDRRLRRAPRRRSRCRRATAPSPVTTVLSGLAPGTTYHVRARATNEEGQRRPGVTPTFATPLAAAPPAASTARRRSTAARRAPRSAGPSSARGRRCQGRDLRPHRRRDGQGHLHGQGLPVQDQDLQERSRRARSR